jgi:hypothetical protein
MTRALKKLLPAVALSILASVSAYAYVPYDTHVRFFESITKDVLRLIPRAMGLYIYQNRYDFLRGMTFMDRDVMSNPGKILDLEEVRSQAYARLMRDIPYCVQAFKGGDIKLDTSQNNLAGRLGMIGNSIVLTKTPEFPDLKYLERFSRALDELISDNVIDIWVFYDGYADYNSLGELMETLRTDKTPTLRHVRNPYYNAEMREDMYAIFRAPDKFNRLLIFTNRDVNNIYSDMINSIADAYTYIWKHSGMDLQHPSYAAPPGTIIERPSRRRLLTGGAVQKPARPVEETEEEIVVPGESGESRTIEEGAAAENE